MSVTFVRDYLTTPENIWNRLEHFQGLGILISFCFVLPLARQNNNLANCFVITLQKHSPMSECFSLK